MDAILNHAEVERIYRDCQLQIGEDDHVIAEGIDGLVRLHVRRITAYRQEIAALLSELPDQFRRSNGGASFKDAWQDKHGNPWTFSFQMINELMLLGSALGWVSYSVPRDMWPSLPKGLPYVVIID